MKSLNTKKSFIIIALGLFFFSLGITSPVNIFGNEPDTPKFVKDIDGNEYPIVKIGDQLWFGDNLRTTRYVNGDPIPLITNDSEWSKLNQGAWCWYDNNSNHDVKYGKLYNWYAVTDSRGLCPEGWHVPTDEEWYEMENYVDPRIYDPEAINWRGSDGATKLKAVTGFYAGSSRGDRGSADEFGFSARMGGYRHIYGLYLNFEGSGLWWTSTQFIDHYALYRMMYFDLSQIRRLVDSKRYGFSVRCMKHE